MYELMILIIVTTLVIQIEWNQIIGIALMWFMVWSCPTLTSPCCVEKGEEYDTFLTTLGKGMRPSLESIPLALWANKMMSQKG